MSEELDPLLELQRFHGTLRRALQQLHTLGELPPAEVKADEAREILELFRGPLVWHDIDEETLLMPAIQAALGTDKIDPGLERCRRDHQMLEELVEAILPHLVEVAAGEHSNPALLKTAALELSALLGGHMELEEQIVFPIARRILSPKQLEQMARALTERMRARAEGAGPPLSAGSL